MKANQLRRLDWPSDASFIHTAWRQQSVYAFSMIQGQQERRRLIMRKHVTDPQLMHCPGGRDSCLALLCFSFVCPISLQFSCYFTKHFSSLSLMGSDCADGNMDSSVYSTRGRKQKFECPRRGLLRLCHVNCFAWATCDNIHVVDSWIGYSLRLRMTRYYLLSNYP